jgi:hypothetical protein
MKIILGWGRQNAESWYNDFMAYVRKVKTGSGATAVQIVRKEGREFAEIIHVGSARTEEGIKKLERKARDMMMSGQETLFNLKKFDK